ncbi:MAG: hypothetical protein ACI94Y_003057 [Maribacter sp.]|jgi:hypothetical protein
MRKTRNIMFKYIFVLLFFPAFAGAQNDMERFSNLFKEIEMDAIHYHAQYHRSSEFEATSIYPFIGTKIDSSFFYLFEKNLETFDIELAYSEFYAVHRFYLTAHSEGLIIREHHDDTKSFQLHYLILNNDENVFLHHQILAFNYGYEGSSGNIESWLIDINKNGIKDIITRQWSQQYLAEDGKYLEQDTFSLFIWEDDDLKEIGIKDEELQEQLSSDFPFYDKPSISYDTGKNLSKYLAKKANIYIPEYYTENWVIVAGSDKNLEAAKFEKNRATDIIAYDYKYHLDTRHFGIYQKNKRYYTIITNFKTKNEAEIALLEIKKKFNATAYVINMDQWCKDNEYVKGGFYQCLD